MESSGMTKKEYLKKYLSGGEKKKKKKKSTQSLIIKSKIVDDDIDLKNMKPIDEDELDIYDLGEEAPQIVGIIDERPAEVRLMSEFRSTKKWKIVTDEYGIEDVKITAIDRRKSDEGSPKMEKTINIEIRKISDRKNSESDESPPRNKDTTAGDDCKTKNTVIKQEINSDSSPPRKATKNNNSDATPPRKSKKNYDSDASPPRKSKKNYDSDASPPRKSKKNYDSDASPPRKSKKNYDSDVSPPRKSQKKNYDSDASPPRRFSKKNSSPPRRRHHNDSDSSPPRKRRHDFDSSPARKSTNSRKQNSSNRKESSDDARSSKQSKLSDGRSSSKKNDEYGLKVNSNHDSSKKEKKNSQLEKTLSGKKAGLQSAEEMRKESDNLRQKEKEMFEKMSDEVTGKHATAIVRNRKTGRRHDAKEEARKKKEKEEKEAERIAQYAVWGKGVKQVQDREDKLKEDLYEMSKPLARYKDDKDLEEMLKNQEREGDPMLEYIRRKKKTETGGPSRPEYEGNYLPNRYNIKPGHKWDGVDRSNGYEKRWFDEQNAKKAREEEAFKWSTIDM